MLIFIFMLCGLMKKEGRSFFFFWLFSLTLVYKSYGRRGSLFLALYSQPLDHIICSNTTYRRIFCVFVLERFA